MSDNFVVSSARGNYKVHYGADIFSDFPKRLREGDVIIADDKVVNLYPGLQQLTAGANKFITLNVSEELKSYQGIIPVLDKLIQCGFRKNNTLVAIGGGVTQDVTAFLASILLRGVNWVFYPTTLLAQCDSCIGSKTSINFGSFKNQLGGFYPPREIIIDFRFLKSLSSNDIRSGLGEMAHYYLVSGEKDFEDFKMDCVKAIEKDDCLQRMILRSLQIKKQYIEIDEYDTGPRNVFNYGHTFGHAIESLTNYNVPHGIAVSYGMDIANYISAKKKMISDSLQEEIRSTLKHIWSGVPLGKIDLNLYKEALLKDKKTLSGQLYCILTRGIGDMFKAPLDLNKETLSWVEHCFNGY